MQQLSITSPLVTIGEANRSNLELYLADGTQRRATLKYSLSDFTVRSILEVLNKILPA